MRIISLVPSLSETIVDLGLRSSLVGCTQFCVEPKDLHRTAKIIGGTKDFSLDEIRRLQPTHILANQEENPKELVLELEKEFPLLLTFPKSPFDVPNMLKDLSMFLNVDFSQAVETVSRDLQAISGLRDKGLLKEKKFLYFIWREPYMVVGRDTYISRFLEAFGFENVCNGPERYPMLEIEAIKASQAEIIFFSTEPYPFRKRDAERLRAAWSGCPEIRKIDGRLMSWYGTMTSEAIAMIGQGLVSPDKVFTPL